MKERDPFHLEPYLRPNYEAWAFGTWAASGGASLVAARLSELPPEPFFAVAGICGLLAAARGSAAFQNWRRRRRLTGKGISFTDHEEVARRVRKEPGQIWLGWGFEWTPKHTQRAMEILSSDWEQVLPRPENPTGAHWLHALGDREVEIKMPTELAKGHMLIAGTTRSGKSVMFRLLISQCVARGEAVIVIDPKGDPELLDETRRACRAHGREFYYLHPAFPEKSVRLNLLRNFARGTDLAGRIASIMPSESGSDPFVAFGHSSLNNVIQALLLIQRRPTLVDLRRELEGGVDRLVIQSVAAWADHVMPGWESQAHDYLAKARSSEKKAWGMLQFYRDRIQPHHPNQDLEGLLAMFRHDREHFQKMIASLLPVLAMLTSSELGPLFSPKGDDPDDDRPIVDLGRIIDEAGVLYVGLSSLSDAQVGGAIGALLMADLAAVAAERYSHGIGDPVHIFVDEAAEAANVPFVQVLNKGGGARLRMYVATQTIKDFEAKLGNAAMAAQLLGNLNNIISLRVTEESTQKHIVGNLPKTRFRYVMRTQNLGIRANEETLTAGGEGERLMEEGVDLFPAQLLGQLPILEYVAKFANGKIVKGRIPVLRSHEKA